MFEDENIGVLNCDSFEKNQEVKKIFEGLPCGAAIADAKKLAKMPQVNTSQLNDSPSPSNR